MDKLEIIKNNVHIIIEDNQKWGVISSKEYIEEFFLELSGIWEKHYIIRYNDRKVLDNEEFFEKRALFDFSKDTVSTLNHNLLKETLDYRYHLDFDEKAYTNYISKLSINKECSIDTSYHFTKKGQVLANFAVSTSLNKEMLIINNPTLHQDKKNIIEEIVNELTRRRIDVDGYTNNAKERVVFLGLDNIQSFEDKLDYLLFINQNHDLFVIDPNKEKILMIDYFEDFAYKAMHIANGKMFLKNDLDKTEYKLLHNKKIKDKTISAYKIETYIKGDE